MSITTQNKLDIAYKRLAGLANTNPAYGTNNETIASNVQLGSFQIFGESIDQNPDNAVNAGIARKSIFKLQVVDSGIRNGKYYVWKLLKYDVATSDWLPYSGQLIPASFGLDYYPKIYSSYTGSGDTDFGALVPAQEISKNSESNWLIDCFASILVFQDLDNVSPSDEWVVVAYEYTGKYLDEVVGSGGGGGTSPLPTEDTLYKPTDANLSNIDYFVDINGRSNTVKYIFLHGNPSSNQGAPALDSSHKVTQLQLWQHQYGINKTKEIVVKNLGHEDPEVTTPSTIEIQVSSDGTDGYLLNGSRDSHYLYAVGETVTLLWDGTEWHII